MSRPVAHDTKLALLEEAESLIRSRGYSGFSYADLSDVIGIRKASIHYHYPTKEELVIAVLDEYKLRYERELTRIKIQDIHALDRIESYAQLYLAGIDRGLGCLCAALAAELDVVPDSLKIRTTAFFEQHTTWLMDIYREGLVKGTVSTNLSAKEAARLILATLEGALLVERMLGGRRGLKTTILALRKILAS